MWTKEERDTLQKLADDMQETARHLRKLSTIVDPPRGPSLQYHTLSALDLTLDVINSYERRLYKVVFDKRFPTD